MKHGWYAFGLLLAACVGAAGKQYVIPPAAANANVQKWDYFCDSSSFRNAQEMSKAAGQQGWELVSFTSNDRYCFKRPM